MCGSDSAASPNDQWKKAWRIHLYLRFALLYRSAILYRVSSARRILGLLLLGRGKVCLLRSSPLCRQIPLGTAIRALWGAAVGSSACSSREKYCHNGGMAFALARRRLA